MPEPAYVSSSPFVPAAPSPGPEAPLAAPAALRPVPPAVPSYDDLVAPASDRIVSLGGQPVRRLASFTVSARLRGRDVLADTDLTPDEILEVLDTAARLKRLHRAGEAHAYLPGKTLGMIFQHPSTRTRVSFEAGMAQLGGQAIFLNTNDLQLKRGETIGDTARVLGRYVDGVVARVKHHSDLVELAAGAEVPVYNGLSDRAHPMQALSDLLTLQERFGSLVGLKLAFVGDGSNNMAASLLLAGAAMGVHVAVAGPAVDQPAAEIVSHGRWLAGRSGAGPAGTGGATVTVTDDPWAAVKDANAVYTDVHVSLGQADEPARAVALAPYKVTEALMAAANPGAVFLHCLPMHRGEEVDAAVADGPQSAIFDQAENRLHLQKAVLLQTMC
ncbi:MAG: Ornithine carbamoyltransferase [uncultured Thermomicrobiales bacterium]|uniref:Ornithine carbamoyltransferase n=1 Tax=uncultured Thermomicrobiales bacterium TaxID=1645740 RepID=A0A6J4UX04_9BACT|nr:MAG: Ornithine carbamoyltransferase [uncultured Thermomicrobiales bacterium]